MTSQIKKKQKEATYNTRFLLIERVAVPSSAGHEDKKLLSSPHHYPLIYFDMMQSYFEPSLTSVYCYCCAAAYILTLANRSFGGEQRGYTVSGFCPNRRSFSWEQEWTERPGAQSCDT